MNLVSYKDGRLHLLVLLPMFASVLAGAFVLPSILNSTEYHDDDVPLAKPREETKIEATHIDTPEAVRAIYVSQCGATSAKMRAYIENLIAETELNAVIIDVKDYSGTVAFRGNGGKGCVVSGMAEWVEELHKQNIYTIARITVFQDPLYTSLHPELAVHRKSATTTPWQDYKGLAFVDVGALEFWKYIVEIARDAHELGFDELNFDYIRYPSDGNMRDVYYTHSGDKVGVVASREEQLERFFRYLSHRLRRLDTKHIPVLSADLFGMTTTNTDDLTIGQVQERAVPYFDYIAPMVYPSHYPRRFIGLDNPNEHVYEVVNYSMESAVKRITATTTPIEYRDKYKLRPWLQDFDYGGDYDAAKVRAQIEATYDAGLNSWMLWNPANRYTREALQQAN